MAPFILDSLFDQLKEEMTQDEQDQVNKSSKKAGVQNALLNFAQSSQLNGNHQNIEVFEEEEEVDSFDPSLELASVKHLPGKYQRQSTKPALGSLESTKGKYMQSSNNSQEKTSKSYKRSVTKPAPGTVNNLRSMFEGI